MKWVFVVLGAVALFLGNLAVWIDAELFHEDEFVERTRSLAHDPEVLDGVASELSDRLVDHVPQAPRDLVYSTVRAAVAQPSFEALWEGQVRAAHRQFMELTRTGGDQIALDFSPVLVQANDLLRQQGFDLIDDSTVAQVDDVIPWKSDRLRWISRGADIVEELRIGGPILAIAMFACAFVVAPNRRRALAAIGIGAATAMAATVVTILVAKRYAENQPDSKPVQAAVSDVLDELFTRLWSQTLLILAAGVLLAVAGSVLAPAARAMSPKGRARTA